MGIHPPRSEERFITGVRIDPDALRRLQQHYSTPETSPVVALMPRLPVAKLVPRRAVYADDAYYRSEPYNEVFRPLGLMHVAIACTLRTPACTGSLGILRRRGNARPDHHDFQLLKRLLPHLNRSVRLYQRFDSLAIYRHAIEEVVERLPYGIVLVDGDGRAFHLNHTAELLVTAGDGVKLSLGILQAATVDETRALHRLIRAVTADTRSPASAGSGMMLNRPWPHRPLWVTVLPIPAQTDPGATGFPMRHPAALVMICDPETVSRLPVENLRRLYGLTPSETRLAQALCSGRSLNEYAEEAGLTIETVRWRLKQIMAKTGTHRQSELVRLLLASCANFVAADSGSR